MLVWRLICKSVPVSVYPSVCPLGNCASIYLSVGNYLCVSAITKCFPLSLLNNIENITWGRNKVHFTKPLAEFYKGLNHWFQRTSINLNNNSTINIIVYQVIPKCCIQPLWWFFFFMAFKLQFHCSQGIFIRTCMHNLSQGQESVKYLLLEPCISLGYKSWFHVESRQVRLTVPLFSG